MIPRLFKSDATEFENLGYGGLTRAISCVVHEELNGTYELNMAILVDDPLFEFIQIGNIIVAQPNMTGNPQAFVIESVEKTITGEATVYATHIAQHRTKFLPLGQVAGNALAGAISALNNSTLEDNPFTFSTDMTSFVGYSHMKPSSVREWMGGMEGSIIDRYGGEWEYDNFNVTLRQRRGRETDARVIYAFNMTSFTHDQDFAWNGSATGVFPYYFTDEGYTIGDIQYSPYIDKYPYHKTVTVDFTEKFEAIPTKDALNAYAQGWIAGKGLPAVTLECSFNQFDTRYVQVNTLQIGDSVKVVNSLYDINYDSRIVAMDFDVLAETYQKITVGSLKQTMWGAISDQIGSGDSAGPSYYFYGTCATAGSTAMKQATIANFPETPYAGLQVAVRFTNANTVANPTLSINGGTAIAIKRYGTTAPSTSSASSWNAGSVVILIYDGTYWVINGWLNTTYSSMTEAEITAGTGTTARIITPARLKTAIQTWALPISDVNTSISPYGKVPRIGNDGVIELGKYIDFHLTNGDTDYPLRITASEDGLALTGQSLTGSSGKLMTAGDFADRVTETGTSGNWAYRKWESGKTEAWRTVTVTASATTQAGSVYRSTATVDLPSGLFNSAPHTIASMDAVGTNLFSVYATASSATNIDVRVWRVNASTATYGVNVSFYCWRG